jgi:nucleoside-diphosphate-sugar epimerase
MRIALTGSRGFIGSHVKTHLESLGCTVDEWDLKIDKPINQIILHKDTEYVIHLAAFADVRESIREPQKYWDNNVTPTTAIQEYCHKLDIPLLYASSSCIHQWHLSPYGMSKKINEETAYENQVGLRFTTVYGEGARDEMLIGRLLDGRVSYLTDHIRDFIHVSDVVMAISLLMRHDLTELKPAYDIGTGKGVIVSDLGVLAGFDIDIKPGDSCEAFDNTADISDIAKLGWTPKYDIIEYIKEKTK